MKKEHNMGIVSKQAMKQANLLPKLQLGTQIIGNDGKPKGVQVTGKHHVKLIEEKAINGKEFETGTPIPMMRYIFEENGEQKQYDARMKDKKTGELHYFVQRMAEINEGDELILEMVKRGMKNVILVTKVGESTEIDADDEELPDDVPTVELD